MIGITTIRVKRGIQWARVSNKVAGMTHTFFFTPMELYSNLNNTSVLKYLNS
jgi:hypothetical protein